MMKKVYQLGDGGKLVRVVELDHSDVCPQTGKILIPRGCIDIEPPPTKEGFSLVFDNGKWEYKNESAKLAEIIRQRRNQLLEKSDWTQLSDSPLTKDKKTAWKTYRQALRDITKQDGFPLNIVFPQMP